MLMSHCLFHGTQLKVKMKYTKKCRQFDAVGERAGKEKKKLPLISVCLFYIFFSKSFVKPKLKQFFLPYSKE